MSVDARIAPHCERRTQDPRAIGSWEVKISSRRTPYVEVGVPLC